MHRTLRQMSGIVALVLAIGGGTAGQAQQTNTLYGETRGWYVSTQMTNGRFTGCMMERPPQGNGFDMLLKREGGQWFVGVPTHLPEGTRTPLDMDVDKYSQVLDATVQNGFLAGPVSHEWVETIGKAGHITIYHDGRANQISPAGTMAAIHKVDECAMNGGVPASATAPAPTPRPAPVPVVQLGANCPAPGTIASPNLQDWGTIALINRTATPLTIYWLDYAGQPMLLGELPVDYRMQLQDTAAGHFLIATDPSRTCIGGLIEVPLGETDHDIR